MIDYIKAIARVLHFSSVALCGSYVTGPLFYDDTKKIPGWNKRAGEIGGILLVISGLVNWYYLKTFKPHAQKRDFVIWTAIVHSKLVLVLIIWTPIITLIIGNKHTVNWIRIGLMAVLFLVSPFVRRLRESYSPKYVNSLTEGTAGYNKTNSSGNNEEKVGSGSGGAGQGNGSRLPALGSIGGGTDQQSRKID